MEASDIVIMVLAGAGVLAVLGVAIIVSMLRANRDADSAHAWLTAQQREQRQAAAEPHAVARVSPRPVSTTERDPTRELIRYRCPRCNAPAARDAAGMLRCLNNCRTDAMRAHRWSE